MNKSEILKISPQALFDEPMKNHTTFRIGGNADCFVSVSDENEITSLIAYCKRENIPYMIMGNGSNMLVGDNGIRGVVIQIFKNMNECRIEGTKAYVQSGALLSSVAAALLRAELTGFEEISGIPGTVGGAVYMNAGAYGGEIKNVIETVTFLDKNGEIKTLSADELDFSYRHSIFEDNGGIILSCVMKLEKGNYDEIRAKMSEYTKRRNDKQPISMPSAGSTFKRPEGYFAGKLIQDSNLMGYSIGGAQVSEKHAGFVINTGNATAADVLALIKHIQDTVYKNFGVMLEPEVRLIGEQE